MYFAVPVDYRVKFKENEKKGKYLDLLRNRKTVDHESDVYTNCYQRIIKVTGGLRNKRTSWDHPNYYIIEIDQNTEKSPNVAVKNYQGVNNYK